MNGSVIRVSPFEFLYITEYSSFLGVNEHGSVTIKGIIKQDAEEKCLQLIAKRVWTEVINNSEDNSDSMLFCGVVLEGQIQSYGDVKELTLKIMTGSYLMDIDRHIRSFEDCDMTYGKILKHLMKSYTDGKVIVNARYDVNMEEYLCQYKETDWQFARRIASHCSALMIPNYMNKGVKYFFGLPVQITSKTINVKEYTIKKSEQKTQYSIKCQEVYDLGERLYFLGKQVIVSKVHSLMEGSDIYHYYELMEETEFEKRIIYNENLAGISLKATIEGVEADKVCLEIQLDEYKAGSKRWFSYATVYSSPDGTGWYCMPEKGDSVRLYFPSSKEDNAFVMNAVHIESSDFSERTKPDYKSIMNKYGKEILLTPNSLILTNNAGMTVELSDAKGICISSDKQIEIESEEAITLMSTQGKIDIVAQEEVTLRQGNTSMVLSDKLRLQGARVKME